MKYMPLKKLFHIDEQKCNEVYERRYNFEFAHRLSITLKNGYECFYVNNDEIINLIDKIYEINTYIEKLVSSKRFPSAANNYLIVSTLLEEIRLTNQIEGIYSTRKELKDIMSDHGKNKYLRFSGMINKYAMLQSECFLPIETAIDVRELYDDILLEDIKKEDKNNIPDGLVFRKHGVEVSSGSKTIHSGINGETEIIKLMDQALKILNNEDINLLIRVALFHYLFEYIHPFYDGNGRMGRFITSGYLSTKLNILCALQLSLGCTDNKKKYYDSFKDTNDPRNKGDLTVFLINFLEIYLDGLESLKEHIDDTFNMYLSLNEKIYENIGDDYYKIINSLLQVNLFEKDSITMKELCAITGYTQQTIRIKINEINNKYNIIVVDKINKPYRYAIDLNRL